MNTESFNLSDFVVTVERGELKNVYLRVLPPNGDVVVRAPNDVSFDEVRRYTISKLGWIRQQRTAFQSQQRFPERDFVEYDTLRVWGDVCRLRIVHSNKRNDVHREGNWVILQTRPNSTPEQRENILNAWFRKELKEALTHIIPQCESIVGQHAEFYGIKKMSTRWGTCNAEKRRIWLNLSLAQKTRESLQFVLIHELVHLIEPHHGDRFTALMARYCPNWRVIESKLNAQPLEIYKRKQSNDSNE